MTSLPQPQPRVRALCLVAALALAGVGAPMAFAKDLKTAFIRLVPEQDWKPAAGQSVRLEVVNAAEHEKAGEYLTEFDKVLREQFGVRGFKLDEKATTTVKVTVQLLDWGNAAMKWAVGFGTGKGYVGGLVEVSEKSKPIGALSFSVKLVSDGMHQKAVEVAAPLVLKLENGERDTELHPMKVKKAKKG